MERERSADVSPLPAGPSGRVTLRVTEGPHEGRSFTFAEHNTFLVGRSPQAHFCLPDADPYFSRLHFLVEVNPPLCRLLDLKSHNGTFVNEQRAEGPVTLRDGDMIRAGTTVLRVFLEEAGLAANGTRVPPLPQGEGAAREVSAAGVEGTLVEAPPSRQSPLSRQAADLLAQQQRDWQQGSRRRVEDYLQQKAGLAEQGQIVLDLIQGEWELRQRCGEPPTVAEYQERFPHLANVLAMVLLPLEGTDVSEVVPATEKRLIPLPTVPGYQIVAEMGRGGMGVVYRALCEADGQLVALKTILPAVALQGDAVRRFLREAKILRELRHPYIVAFRDMGTTGDILFFAMDFVVGTDAARLVRSEGPLAAGRALRLIGHILEALSYAHQHGFVHRDLKPGNVLVTMATEGEVAKLADFGLARTYLASPLSGLTLVGSAAGTPQFMPPEQVTDFRSVKPAGDQYAAAATLYYLLTGQPLYVTQSVADLFKRILRDDPPPVHQRRPELSAELGAAIQRALARKPENRYPDVDAFRQALLPFAEGLR